jgi:hypothetical protein
MSGRHTARDRSRSLTRRGKVVVAAATVLLVGGGALGYFVLFPEKAPAFVRDTLTTVGIGGLEAGPPDPTCPLTGQGVPRGEVPMRPALAVKVENYPDARPQAGLNAADIVFEEPVEGGITRFIVIYQCDDASRVGPVRSARTTDPDVLSQFGVPVFAYSGGAPNVERDVADSDLIALDETTGGNAFTRDANRAAPHNLYVDTESLYRVAKAGTQAPGAVFRYAPRIRNRSRMVKTIHLPFSSTYSDVYWAWDKKAQLWTRSHGTEPHMSEDGEPVSAVNVVVQLVDVVIGPNGGSSPHLDLTGSGRAWVFRNGRMIVGRWERDSHRDVTRFISIDGSQIALMPGRTWVELLSSTALVETDSRRG